MCSGICLGGPMEGEKYASDQPIFCVSELDGSEHTNLGPDDKLLYKDHIYKFKGNHIWVYEGINSDDWFNYIINRFCELAKENRDLKEDFYTGSPLKYSMPYRPIVFKKSQ